MVCSCMNRPRFKPHGNVDMLSTQHVYCCYDLRVRRSAIGSNQSQSTRARLTRTNTGNTNFAPGPRAAGWPGLRAETRPVQDPSRHTQVELSSSRKCADKTQTIARKRWHGARKRKRSNVRSTCGRFSCLFSKIGAKRCRIIIISNGP